MGIRRVTPELEDRVVDWLGGGKIGTIPWFVPPWGSGAFRSTDKRGSGPRRGSCLCRLQENRGKLRSPQILSTGMKGSKFGYYWS